MNNGTTLKNEKPFFILAPVLLWQLLFFYLPLFFILVLSVFQFNPELKLTSSYYSHFFTASYFLIIGKSLLLALTTCILCFLIGYPLAYFISFKAKKFKNIFLFLLIVPFWTNFLLHIYAWFYVLDKSGFINMMLMKLNIIKEPLIMLNSLPAIVLLMVYSYLPFMVLPIYSVLERFDRKLIEASADLGASFWQTFLKVEFPLSITGIITGCALVFVPSFGEFAIPSLMGGDKYVFVGTVIAQYILASKTISLGSAFTVISCLILLLGIATMYMIMRTFFKRNMT